MAAKTQQFDWDDARVLLALFRERTLRGAGEKLGVNASTIGRRLDGLEQALAARLFDRTLDGVLPTAAAERLLAHAEQLEQAALGLCAAAEGFEREPEGVVRVSAMPGIADHFIAPSLLRIHERYPRLRLELDSSIGYADLTRREADIALRIMRPTTGDLVAQKLTEDRDTVLGSSAYVRELGTLKHLADARWLDWGHDLALLPSSQWLRARVPEERIVMRSSSINALLSAAEHGVGLVLLTDAFRRVRPLVQAKLSPQLAAQTGDLTKLELWLVGHRALRDIPRVAVVWDFIIEELARILKS
ncbi:MAG TPA: LysR family transcriptional regulator [Polyangiales bacterium]|nr:LysR family transcriptional regulator [Polyangiales bacterium]